MYILGTESRDAAAMPSVFCLVSLRGAVLFRGRVDGHRRCKIFSVLWVESMYSQNLALCCFVDSGNGLLFVFGLLMKLELGVISHDCFSADWCFRPRLHVETGVLLLLSARMM